MSEYSLLFFTISNKKSKAFEKMKPILIIVYIAKVFLIKFIFLLQI